MRWLSLVAVLVLMQAVLASCTAESFATKIDDRTYKIEGTGVPGGADAPNRRMAARVCPNGYRVLDQRRYKTDPDTGTQTDWVIRCL